MQVANIFTGIVEDVSDYGVLMRAMNGKKSLFFRDHIVGILEEEVVQKQEIPKPVPQPLSIDSLNDMLLKR
jgi:hypothetical protein